MTALDQDSALLATRGETALVRTAICRALQRLERTVERAMGPQLAAGPYRGLLLEIYLAEMEGKTIFQSSLSTDAATSKPHRRSIRLAQLGALIREPDRRDRRRTDLRLTPMTKGALDHTMDLVKTLFSGQTSEFGPLLYHTPELMRSEWMWYKSGHGQAAVTVTRGNVIVDGRIALPADIRRALGIQNGDTLLFELEGNELRIRPARSALQRAQERLRSFAPEHHLASEQLIAKRRREASNG